MAGTLVCDTHLIGGARGSGWSGYAFEMLDWGPASGCDQISTFRGTRAASFQTLTRTSAGKSLNRSNVSGGMLVDRKAFGIRWRSKRGDLSLFNFAARVSMLKTIGAPSCYADQLANCQAKC